MGKDQAVASGLIYRRTDGVEVPKDDGEQWLVSFSPDGDIGLTRYINGQVNEVYSSMTPRKAAVALTAIFHGFEPPRRLTDLETPSR